MADALPTAAEQRAQQATELSAFSALNLVKIRGDVREVLSHFGRLGIFQQYTKHDMSHVDGMLKMYEWLIPEDTKGRMSPADWLLLTLATYFHDFALIVTQAEFDRRNDSGFPKFVAQFAGAKDAQSSDYRVRVNDFEESDREKFLYQEFVRDSHPKRISSWLTGKPDPTLGFDPDLVSYIYGSISGVEPAFLKDLGLVCESHHLEDLNNTTKYPVDRPYGPTDSETANVQYAAIMLRTADLLHITSDRAPSVALRTINPTDPVSQVEWSKQNAVRTVRAAPVRSADGVIDRSAPRDTIEVHAEFTDENGFFGLTSYLQFADREIRQNYRWAAASNAELDAPHRYPWRSINADSVIADGFIAEPFEFQIDQYKVLELLTGHTLYNDTDVVVREIVQNAIDAVRLQVVETKRDPNYEPVVQIHWNARERLLEVHDNGTGMTQSIIEGNFLRVGSSRYQEPQFKRDHPGFTSISRFGIGVLSTFMVADEVRVITCSAAESKARELTLRSVHGKYLIRLLEKSDPRISNLNRAHGTSVRMRIRPSAQLTDIERILRYWIVVPRCQVLFYPESGAKPMKIGHGSVDEAMGVGTSRFADHSRVEVRSRVLDGAHLAYTVRWNDYFKQFSLISSGHSRTDMPTHPALANAGTCVEGIRVTSYPLGYSPEAYAWALVDVVGNENIRTNVARTAIEPSPTADALAGSIYSVFADHINTEVLELHRNRGFSATRAASEANYLVGPITAAARSAKSEFLENAVESVTAYLVEDVRERKLLSLRELAQYSELAVLEGPIARNTEHFLASIPTTATLRSLLSYTGLPEDLAPDVPLLCNWSPSSQFGEWLVRRWEISDIRPKFGGEVLDVRLQPRRLENEPRWVLCLSRDTPRRIANLLSRTQRQDDVMKGLWVQNSGVNIGIDPSYEIVTLGSVTLLLETCPLLGIKEADSSAGLSRLERLHLVGYIYTQMATKVRGYSYTAFMHRGNRLPGALELGPSKISELMTHLSEVGIFSLLDQESTFEAIGSMTGNTYDTWRSQRRDP